MTRLSFLFPELLLLVVPLLFVYFWRGRFPALGGYVRVIILALLTLIAAVPLAPLGGKGVDVVVVADLAIHARRQLRQGARDHHSHRATSRGRRPCGDRHLWTRGAHRTLARQQVIRQNPDLIVSHLSCLLDARMSNADEALEKHLFAVAANRLTLFLGYVGTANPRTRFLVYSRSQFAEKDAADKWVSDVEARFPMLKGRVSTMSMPGGRASATFRDPATAQILLTRSKESCPCSEY